MNSSHVTGVLLLIIAGLAGVVIGLITGLLSWLGGSHVTLAVRHGGIAFGGTVSLALMVMSSGGWL